LLKDIIEPVTDDRDKSYCIDANYFKGGNLKSYFEKSRRQVVFLGGTASVNDNDRVKAITENDRGYRPHKGDDSKSGISELGRILKESAKKTDTITASHAPKLATNEDINNLKYRKLTPRECMRLQTIPEHHIDTLLNAGISNTQLYKMTGNAWTMEVIKHILKGITKC